MKTVISGEINNFVPVFHAYIGKTNNLIINVKGNISLTVDTGFSGGIALPLEIIERLGMELVVMDTFKLATREIIELPVFSGSVWINNEKIETWFIPGDSLVGMEFLYSAGKYLSLYFDNNEVKLKK